MIQGAREPSSIWDKQLKRQRTENTRNGTTLAKFKIDTIALIVSFSFIST